MKLILKRLLLWALVTTIIVITLPAYSLNADGAPPVITSTYVATALGNDSAAGNNGTETTITVTGTNLTGVTAVTFYKGAALDTSITFNTIVPNAGTPDLKFRVNVVTSPDTPAGPRNMTVTTPSGTSAPFANGFTVYRASVGMSISGAITPGNTVDVFINIDNIANLNSYQFDLNFNQSVIQVDGEPLLPGGSNFTGVTDGLIHDIKLGDRPIPTTGWTFQPDLYVPSGRIRVIGQMGSANKSLTGSGYLVKISFLVKGTAGMNTSLTLSDLGIFNSNAFSITPDTVNSGFLTVSWLFINNTSLPEATAGAAYSAGMTAANGTPPYTWSATGLPAGLTLNSGTGAITGTPATSGNFSVSFTILDSQTPTPSASNKVLLLKVYPAMQITTTSLASGEVNQAYLQTLMSTGGKAPYAWDITSGSLPPGLLLDIHGNISGTPLAASGPTVITFSVTDALGSTASAGLSLTIIGRQPVVTTSTATGIGLNTATVNGILNIRGSALNVNLYFEYWTGSNTPSRVAADPASASADNTVFSASLSNLSPNTTYTFHARAEGYGSPVNGSDLTFKTVNPGTVDLSLLPQISRVNLNENFNISIQADAGQFQADRIDTYIAFDPSSLEVIDADAGQPDIQITPGAVLTTVFTNTANNTTGLISYSAGKADSPFPTGVFTVAAIQFKVKDISAGSTALTFLTSGTGTITMVKFSGNNITGVLTGAAVQFPVDPPLFLDPAEVSSVNAGQTFNMEIKTSAGSGQQVDHVQAYVNFDPARLEVMDVDNIQAGVQITPGAGLSTILENTADNIDGLISYSAEQSGSPFPSGSFTVATIRFRAKPVAVETTTPVVFSLSGPAATSVVEFEGTLIAGTHVNSTVHIIPVIASLDISVVLQSSSRPPSGWAVPLTVRLFTPGANVMTATPLYTFNLTTTKSGSTAVAQAAEIISDTYDILIASEHCLCNVKRGVLISSPSTQVNMGTLLEGDANGDHLVNIQDFGILAKSYGKSTGTPDYDARADFNRDTIVSISDFGLLAANYGKVCPIEIP